VGGGGGGGGTLSGRRGTVPVGGTMPVGGCRVRSRVEAERAEDGDGVHPGWLLWVAFPKRVLKIQNI